MHFVRRHKLNSHATVPIHGLAAFQTLFLPVDLNDYFTALNDLDQAGFYLGGRAPTPIPGGARTAWTLQRDRATRVVF
jgi:hypothetical protein